MNKNFEKVCERLIFKLKCRRGWGEITQRQFTIQKRRILAVVKKAWENWAY